MVVISLIYVFSFAFQHLSVRHHMSKRKANGYWLMIQNALSTLPVIVNHDTIDPINRANKLTNQ